MERHVERHWATYLDAFFGQYVVPFPLDSQPIGARREVLETASACLIAAREKLLFGVRPGKRNGCIRDRHAVFIAYRHLKLGMVLRDVLGRSRPRPERPGRAEYGPA